MAQLSRPYQIGLAGVVLLLAVWVLALRGHSNSSSSAPAAPASVATTHASPPASPKSAAGSHVYHGAAPGVEGLTRAVSKAHEAVATSERNASQLQRQSEQASSATPSSPSASSTPATQSPTHAAGKSSSSASASTGASAGKASKPAAPSSGAAAHNSISARQRASEAALKKGDVVVLLFWDPHGTDDVAVHKAVQSLAGERKVFTSQAPAGRVASYGSITRGIQVYGTPTVLIVNSKGQTITLTGLQDAYSIRQAIAEARHS